MMKRNIVLNVVIASLILLVMISPNISADFTFHDVDCDTGDVSGPTYVCYIGYTITNIGLINGNGASFVFTSGGFFSGSFLNTTSANFINFSNITFKSGSGIIGIGNITINTKNLTMETGSFINVSGLGYPRVNGTGAGKSGLKGSGAGYAGAGGAGSNPGGTSYGSLTNPRDYGSGGGDGTGTLGASGGGIIILNISDRLNIQGILNASGFSAITNANSGGGGSGGSIFINASILNITGSLYAKGGNSGSATAGSGSGGRIAIYTITNLSAIAYNVDGGSVGFTGGNGSFYYNGKSYNDTVFPIINITYPINNSNITSSPLTINYTYIEPSADTCWWTNNNGITNTTLSGCSNTFTYIGTEAWNNVILYINDTSGNTNSSRVSFFMDTVKPSIVFVSPTPANNSALSNSLFNLTIAISVTDDNFANTTLRIYNSTVEVYNQTNYSSSFTYQFNPPRNGTYYFNATTYDIYGNVNRTETRQVTFYDFYFTICNSTINIPYLNVSFYDEITGAPSMATITGLIATYYAFDSTVTKTYTFTNLTANSVYSFCATPPQFRSNMSISFTYTNTTGYSSRTYTAISSYSNATTLLNLAMLPTGYAQWVTFQTQTAAQQAIPDVTVNVYTLQSGVWTLITSSITDAAGAVSFQLNPFVSHLINYSKVGYATYTQTVQPTQSLYTIFLTPSSNPYNGIGGGIGGSTYIPYQNLSLLYYNVPNKDYFAPNDSIQVYFNATVIGGGTSLYGGSKIELWANSTYMINSSSMLKNGTTTSISVIGNFSNYKSIIAKFYVSNTSNTSNYILVYMKEFKVMNISEGDYSLGKGLKSWGNLTMAAGETFENAFSNGWWIFFIICILISAFCYSTGVELTNPMAISIGFTMILAMLAYGDLLYIDGLAADWINRWIIVIIAGLFNIGYLFSVWRERG